MSSADEEEEVDSVNVQEDMEVEENDDVAASEHNTHSRARLQPEDVSVSCVILKQIDIIIASFCYRLGLNIGVVKPAIISYVHLDVRKL